MNVAVAERIELEAHQHLIPGDAADVYRVAAGRLALYAVEVRGGEVVGQRQYLLTLGEGAVWTGANLDLGGRTMVIQGAPMGVQGMVERLDPKVVTDPASPGHGELWGGLLEYCQVLGQLLAKSAPTPQFCERPGLDAPFEFAAGTSFRPPGREPSWLTLDEGEIVIYGEGGLALDGGSPVLPTMEGTWFLVKSPVKGVFRSFSQRDVGRTRLSECHSGLGRLARLVLVRAHETVREQERAEVRRLQLLEKERARQSRSVVRNLSLDADDDLGVEDGETPLLTALAVIGRETGIEFRPPTSFDPAAPRKDQLEGIVRNSGTRMRRVKLDGAWWHDDVGSVLAFRKETGHPVALICQPRWGGLVREYVAIDVVAREILPVDEPLADTLEDDGHTFVVPLPEFGDKVDPFKMAWFASSPYMRDMALLFGLSMAGSLLGMVMPMANRLMMDQVIPDANRSLIVDLAFGMTAVSIGLFVFSLSQGLITMRIQNSITARLQSAVIDRLLRLPNRFFRGFSSGDLLNRSMMITEISSSFSNTVTRSLLGLLSVGMMLMMCFYYSSKLAWLAVFTAIATSILSISASFLIKKIALESEVESGKLFGFVVQMIHGVTKLQVSGAEDRAFAKWSERYGALLRARFKVSIYRQTSGVLNGFLQTASSVALFYLAGRMVQETAALQAVSPMTPPLLTIGTFFAFQGAFNAVVGGIVGFFGTFVEMHQIFAKRDLVKPILEAEIESSVEKEDPGRLEGHLSMQNVVFRYQEGLPLILDKLSFEAAPGEFVAVVGPSGSGKSTLLKLLLGFEFPESGVVLYDGRDLSSLDLAAVRRQIGCVLQGGTLNAGSIYQIISGAKPLSLDECWAAAEEAGFADDVKQMPMGMHTLLPEGASTLSGGQRQRLTIARALALDPRIIFFDEATSALDNRTQAIVSANLNKRKITRVVVAHRLSTIKDADRIYVVEKGQVKESGNYESLMKEKGLFHRLAVRQLTE